MRALKKRAARTSLWWIQRTTRKAATMKSTRRRKKVRFNSWRGLQALLVQALPGLPAYNRIGYTKIGMNAYCRTGLGRARREGPRVRTPLHLSCLPPPGRRGGPEEAKKGCSSNPVSVRCREDKEAHFSDEEEAGRKRKLAGKSGDRKRARN